MENNNQNESSKAIEEFWIKNRLPKEVESLPYELLTPSEQEIIDKIKNGEDLTEEEITIIKQLRIEYDEPLRKYNAEEIIKSNVKSSNCRAVQLPVVELVLKCTLPPNKIRLMFGFLES